MKDYAKVLLLLILFPSYLLAEETCPLFSQYLGHKENNSSTHYLLCEEYSPHRYKLINLKEEVSEFFLINTSDNSPSLISKLKTLNWNTNELDKIKKRYDSNKVKEGQFLVKRQSLAAISLLNYANSGLKTSLSQMEPCQYNISSLRDLKNFKVNSYLMSCFVNVSEEDKMKLGLDRDGEVSLLEIKSLLKEASIVLQSKTTRKMSSLDMQINPAEFSKYDLIITKKDENNAVELRGTCTENIYRKISSQVEKTFRESRSKKTYNPLDFPVTFGDIEVNFPMNVLVTPVGKRKSNIDRFSPTKKNNVDLDLGAHFNVPVLGTYNLSISPSIILPISQNVDGISETFQNINISDSFTPKEVGVKFEMKF